jgi:hypothetical protein
VANESIEISVTLEHLLRTLAVVKRDAIVDILIYKVFCVVEDRGPDRTTRTIIPFRLTALRSRSDSGGPHRQSSITRRDHPRLAPRDSSDDWLDH